MACLTRFRHILIAGLLVAVPLLAFAQARITTTTGVMYVRSVLLTASSYLNWGATTGTTGYGVRDNAGQMQFKDSGGAWTAFGAGAATNFWSRAATTVSLATAGDTVNLAGSTMNFTGVGNILLNGTTGQLWSNQTTVAGALKGVVTSGTALVLTASSTGNGVNANVLSGSAALLQQSGSLSGDSGSSVVLISRSNTLNGHNMTAPVLDLNDTTAATGYLLRLQKASVNQLSVDGTGNLIGTGAITLGNQALTAFTGGVIKSNIQGQLGVGGPAHNNVILQIASQFVGGGGNTFTPATGSTTAYGFVSQPIIAALDATTFDRLTGGMFLPILITGATHTLTDASSLDLFAPTLTDGGGGVITNAATLMIEGAPTFSGTITNGARALLIKAGTSQFGGDVTLPAIKASSGTRYVCIDTAGKLVSSALACSGT